MLFFSRKEKNESNQNYGLFGHRRRPDVCGRRLGSASCDQRRKMLVPDRRLGGGLAGVGVFFPATGWKKDTALAGSYIPASRVDFCAGRFHRPAHGALDATSVVSVTLSTRPPCISDARRPFNFSKPSSLREVRHCLKCWRTTK